MNEKTTFFWFSLAGKALIATFYIGLLAFFLYIPLIVSFFKPSPDELNICIFSEMLSTAAIAEFEKTHHVRVNVTNFELDEELYVKFRINQGEGYDVVIVSEYLIPHLIKHKYLEPIDKKKVPSFADLDDRLLNRDFDPENTFSIPALWLYHGLLYDASFFKEVPTWATIYQNPHELVARGW